MKRGYQLALVLLLIGGVSEIAWADELKLKDGTKLSATLLQKDGESVIVQFPRASIVTVNGKPLPPPVVAGRTAPEFTAKDLSGTTHTLAETRGHVTLLQFWASWCPHCRSDLPYVKELVERYKNKGLQVLTVSVDREPDKLQGFIQEQQVAYPVISATAHPDVSEQYEVQGIPTYFLIDAKGTITNTWSGSLTEGKAEGKTELEHLLASLLTSPGT